MALTKVSGDILKQPLNVGIITATSINVSGISTLGITSATSLVVSGISTLGITSATNLTSQSLVVSGISTLGITSTTNLTSQSLVVSGISTLGITSATNLTSQSLVVSGISTLGITSATNLTSQSLVVSGISTLGITSATNLTSQSLVVSGISTLGITSATNLTSQSLVVSGISTLGITSATNLTSQSLVVSGISTFTNGPILVGTATSTGTASQPLQVTGGAYVSGNLGIGTTNPQGSLDVHADQNTSTILYVRNPNSGSSARTRIIASSDSGAGSIAMGQHSSNYAGASNQGWLWTSGASTPLVLGTVGTERVRVTTGGNVGIATTNPQYTLHVVGSFAATTKSFVIDHPTKPNYKLRYASLEGAENGVYVRGRTTENIIELPEYWTELVDKNSITVNLTPIGDNRVWIEEINNNKVYIDSNSDIDCFYTVFAERKDVEKLIVEIEGN